LKKLDDQLDRDANDVFLEKTLSEENEHGSQFTGEFGGEISQKKEDSESSSG
jgi:hypothetical protein